MPETFDKDGVKVTTENRAVPLTRTILKQGKPVPYEYMWQVAPGPCVVLAFENLWSFVHGKLPNLQVPLILDGISRSNLEQLFSLVYGGAPDEKDTVELPKDKIVGKEHLVAQTLLDLLGTYSEGTMVCGLRDHCTVIQRYEDLFVKIDPQNQQGLEVLDRDAAVTDISSRLGQSAAAEQPDYFFFPHAQRTID